MAKLKMDTSGLPDWWQRETQKRQLRTLVFLALLLSLIGFYYYISNLGVTGAVGGIAFDTSNHIAFVRQDKEGKTRLYSIRADGTELVPLTKADDSSDKSGPYWTADGKSLLYSSNRADRQKTQIYLLGEGEPKQLTYGTGRKDSPTASPDGRKFAFVTQGAVKTLNPNGTEVDQVIPQPRSGNADSGDTPSSAGEVDPTGPFLSTQFAPDGHGIAGVQELGSEINPLDYGGLVGGDQIVRAFPAGAEKVLPLDAGHEASFAWGSDGKRLVTAFAQRPAPDPDNKPGTINGITIWNFDEKGKPAQTRVIVNFGDGFMPRNIAWSPDGSRIAFEEWWRSSEKTEELKGIVVMEIPPKPIGMRGKDSPVLPCAIPATADGMPKLPRWSPDGSRILYQVTRTDGKNDLWVINNDLTNPLNLTKGIDDNTQGVWSPAKPK